MPQTTPLDKIDFDTPIVLHYSASIAHDAQDSETIAISDYYKDREIWDDLSAEQQQKELNEIAEDWLYQQVNFGWYEKDK